MSDFVFSLLFIMAAVIGLLVGWILIRRQESNRPSPEDIYAPEKILAALREANRKLDAIYGELSPPAGSPPRSADSGDRKLSNDDLCAECGGTGVFWDADEAAHTCSDCEGEGVKPPPVANKPLNIDDCGDGKVCRLPKTATCKPFFVTNDGYQMLEVFSAEGLWLMTIQPGQSEAFDVPCEPARSPDSADRKPESKAVSPPLNLYTCGCFGTDSRCPMHHDGDIVPPITYTVCRQAGQPLTVDGKQVCGHCGAQHLQTDPAFGQQFAAWQ